MSDVTRPSDDIKRRLLAGEPLTSAQTAEEYGVSTALLGTVIRKLKNEDIKFTVTRIRGAGQPKQFQRASDVPGTPSHLDESNWGKGTNVVSLMANTKRVKAKAATPKSTPAPKPPAPPKPRKPKQLDVPVPALGATLRVALLMVNDDGVVSIGLNNGTQAWTAEVIGYHQREEIFDGDREG